jgi:myo-inositol-1(or 4)-monophosphatase
MSLAAELVREAGTLAAEMLGEGLEIRYKTSISDVVSAADHAAERTDQSQPRGKPT